MAKESERLGNFEAWDNSFGNDRNAALDKKCGNHRLWNFFFKARSGQQLVAQPPAEDNNELQTLSFI